MAATKGKEAGRIPGSAAEGKKKVWMRVTVEDS